MTQFHALPRPRRLPLSLSQVLLFTCCLLSSVLCLPAFGAEAKKAFDVPVGDAAATLKQFAQQAGQQVVYPAQDVKGVQTAPVKGRYTLKEALNVMLAGTGLVAAFDEKSSTFAVSRDPAPNAPRLARKDSDQPGEQKNEIKDGVIKLDTFEVFGRKSLNMDIQRTRDDAQPYVVFSSDSIERSGATSLEDFFRTQLPMNAVSVTNSQTAGAYLGATSEVNLRGLGSNQTLILIDGRRLPSINASNVGARGFNQPDVNGIPLSAIERIEVLPTTASGIYGGAATGGVVNIILKREYSSVEAKVTYENAFDTDVGTRRAEFTAGLTLEKGLTHVLLSASWSDSNDLRTGDRDFVQRARDELFARNPASFLSHTLGPPAGYTTNIRNNAPLVNGVRPNLVLKNGVALNSAFTFVPVGYAGPGSDGGAALAANAGKYNLVIPDTLEGARRSLLATPTRRSLSLNVRRNFGSRLEVFLDFSHLQNNSTTDWISINPVATLPVTAPNNPFTTPIVVRFPAVNFAAPRHVDTGTLRGVAGVVLQLPRTWMAAADYGWSRSRVTAVSTLPSVGDPDGAGPGISAITAWNNGTLDVMRDLNALPLNWGPYLLPSPNEFAGPMDTVLETFTLRAGGPIVQLPAGPLKLSGLFERRDEEAKTSYVDAMDAVAADGVMRTTVVPARSQSVESYYLEARAPVFSNLAKLGTTHALELQASVRRDDYGTRAPAPRSAVLASRSAPLPAVTYFDNELCATKGTVGLRYTPVRDVVVRASVGTGFLPPTITQVASTFSSSTGPAADPKRGNTFAPVPSFVFITGGNPDLLPEQSESWSAGVVFTPRFVPGLRFSVDYTRIRKTDEIAGMSIPTVLDLEDLLPGRVKRLPLTPADAALGYTGGVITEINVTNLNLARTEAVAWDCQADYTWKHEQAGEFHVYAVATWQPKLLRQTLPTTLPIDAIGFTDGPLEWRTNVGVNWNRGPWTLGWNTQYFDSRRPYASTSSPATAAATVITTGFERSPSQIYHDVFARYRFGAGSSRWGSILANMEIACGIQNVFDRLPTIVGTTAAIGGFDTFGDPRLRRYSISLTKRF